MQFELMASMMCANYGNLEQEVRDLEAGGIDSFHIDIMDGRFVANFAMSLNDMSYILRDAWPLLGGVHAGRLYQRDKRNAEGRRKENRRLHGGGHVNPSAGG